MPKLNDLTLRKRIDNILESAFCVFSDKGYAASTIDDISSKSKVSKGGIYSHFRSKEDIFFAIAKKRFELRSSLLMNYENCNSIIEYIESYVSESFINIKNENTTRAAKFFFEFWSICSRDEDLKSKANEHYGLYKKSFYKIIKTGIHNNEFPAHIDIDSAIFILLSSLDGIAYTSIVMGIELPRNISKIYADMIKAMLISSNKGE